MGGVGDFLGSSTGMTRFNPKVQEVDLGAFNPNAQERSFTDQLMARMQGQGPSVAELQMQQGLDQALAQAVGLAAAQRGISPGLAARMAQQAQAQNSQAAVGQAGLMRAQEQLANAGLLGGTLESQRNARGMGQQLNLQRSLGEQEMRANAFEGAANRGQKTLHAVGEGGAKVASGMYSGGVAGYADGGQVMDSLAQSLNQQLSQILANQIQTPGPTPVEKNSGGLVPGKAVVPGDHEANDTVPALLSPGEIVVPRTVVAKGPEAASAFVRALMERA